ncbi:MAG TPA: hypothetical protein VGK47_14810 [Nitrososphaeraceae archaeon]
MIKNHIVFEIKKDERNYQLLMNCDSPLGEIHDVLSEMKSVIVQKMIEADKNKTSHEESNVNQQ